MKAAMEPEVFGSYTLLRRIATGGTAEIYLARRHGVDGFARHLAIKRILPHLANDRAFVQLLLDEARLAAHLHHGHIVQIHEVGVEQKQAYIAMEYLPGTDVGRLLQAARKRRRRLLVVHRDVAARTALVNALGDLDVDVARAADAAEARTRSAEGAIDLAVVEAGLLGPIRDPLLHALETAHPELLRTIIVGRVEGRGHGVHALVSESTRPEAIQALARQSLAQRVPLELTLQLVRAVADGLDHAHAATDFEGRPLQIVHRDVNPSNVLVATSGTVKLVDFGIARAAISARRSDSGNFVGTYHYMSPEQCAGKEADARSDLYSLGTLLIELVTGRHPFQGDNQFATMRAIREITPPPLDELIPGVPRGLVDIARRAGEKDPERRYQRADEMLAEVEDFVRREGLNLSPKRMAGFMSVVFGQTGLARFGVSGTGYPVRPATTPAPPAEPAARVPVEVDVDLDDLEPADAPDEEATNPEQLVARRHPVEDLARPPQRAQYASADDAPTLGHPLGVDPPGARAAGGDGPVKVVLALLIATLLGVAGWYWHWRSNQG